MGDAGPDQQELLQRATASLQAGDLATCWQLVQELLASRPVSVAALELLGVLLFQTGRHGEAYEPFREVARHAPLNPLNQFRLALASEVSGRIADAEQALIRTVLIAPAEGQAWMQRSGQCWRLDRADSALAAAGRAVILQPGDPATFHARAQMRLRLGEKTDARHDLIREALLAPERGQGILLLAETFRAAGQPKAAERLYRRQCHFSAPHDPAAWLALAAWLMERRRTDDAVPVLRRVLCLAPGHPDAWDKLASALTGNRSGQRAERAVLAAAVSAPGNGAAWLRMARRLSGDTDSSARRKTAILMAARCAEAAPDTQFALAEFLFQVGDRAEAASWLARFFRETHKAILARQVGPGSARAAALFLNFVIFRQRPAACLPYLSGLDPEAGGDQVGALFLTKIRLLAELDAAYAERPHRWRSSARQIVSLPVWGAEYVDTWLEWGLPSLLADANAPFWEQRETVVHVLTTPEDWLRLSRSDGFARLQERAAVIFLDMTPIIREKLSFGGYFAMCLGHWVSICIARQEAADFVGLVADYMFADGALGYLASETAADRMAAAFTVDLPFREDGLSAFRACRTPAGTLDIPARTMVDAFLGHPSSRVSAHEVGVGCKTIPSGPSRLNARFGGGWCIASMQPQLFFVNAALAGDLWYPDLPATDNGFADMALNALGSTERMRMLNEPMRFGCVAIERGDDARAAEGEFADRHKSDDPVADLAAQVRRSRFVTPARMWALENPMYVMPGGAAPASEPEETILSSLRRTLGEPDDIAVLTLAREIGFPAFERFLEWRDGSGDWAGGSG